MLHIENFVSAVREGRTSDAMKAFKAHLDEEKERVKGDLVHQAAEDYGMQKKVVESEEEDEDDDEDEPKDGDDKSKGDDEDEE